MSDTATVPTDEQLKEYAAQLPDLYKDILAAFQYADPSRDRGEGLFEETLANFLWNEATRSRLIPRAYMEFAERVDDTSERMAAAWARVAELDPLRSVQSRAFARRYRFTQAVNEYNGDEFSAAIDHLIAEEFLKPRTADSTERLVPTDVGERLIEIIAGKPAPAKKVPALPKPTWR